MIIGSVFQFPVISFITRRPIQSRSFIFQKGDAIVPLEVKAEENLRAKSLRLFIKDHPDTIGIRTSMSGYRKQDWMTNLPLYA